MIVQLDFCDYILGLINSRGDKFFCNNENGIVYFDYEFVVYREYEYVKINGCFDCGYVYRKKGVFYQVCKVEFEIVGCIVVDFFGNCVVVMFIGGFVNKMFG